MPQGLRDPPPYDATHTSAQIDNKQSTGDDDLPAYSELLAVKPPGEKSTEEPAPDVLHFLTSEDTLQSLSLAYGVPPDALRKTNNVYSDHLIKGRKTVLIPGEHYKGGVSLSPQPLESEEEEIRKNKIRRWMVTCKCAE